MIPYTTIPFVSAFFLVLVGVLIGQLFWSNFRTKHQRMLMSIRRRLRQQRQELRNRANEYKVLSQHSSATTRFADEQSRELEQRRHECHLLQSTQQELTDRLNRETQARKDLTACLEDERQRHEESSRQVALLRLRVAQDGTMNEQTQRKLDEAEKLSHTLSEQLERNEQSSRHELASAQEQLDRSMRELSVISQRCADLHRDKMLLSEQLQSIDNERQQLSEQIDASRIEQGEWQKLVVERQQDRDAVDHWRAEADRMSRSLESQSTEVGRLTDEVQTLGQELDCARTRYKQLEETQDRLAEAEQGLSVQLECERTKRLQLESVSDRLKSQLDDARREVDRLALVEDRSVEVEAQYRQANDELKRMRRERDDALQIEIATRQIVGELRDELNERLNEVEVLRRDQEVTANQLEFERRQRKQIEEALDLAENRLAVLQSEKDGWTERQSRLVAQATELTEQVRKWQTQAYEVEQRGQRAERQVAELARQLDSQQQLADKMRYRRFIGGDSETNTDGRVGFSFRDLRIHQPAVKDESGELSAPELELGSLVEQATWHRDDLKKIPGIADRVEEQLHHLGVFTYRQMMEWDRKAIAEISRRLGLGDLVERHDWVSHARRLYHENERHIA